MDTRMTSKGLPSPDHPGRLASRLAIRENTGGQPRKDAGNSTGGTDGSGGDGGRVAAAVAGTGHKTFRNWSPRPAPSPRCACGRYAIENGSQKETK